VMWYLVLLLQVILEYKFQVGQVLWVLVLDVWVLVAMCSNMLICHLQIFFWSAIKVTYCY